MIRQLSYGQSLYIRSCSGTFGKVSRTAEKVLTDLPDFGVGNDFHEHAFIRLELKESVFEAD